jgi:hypothetical protein
VDDTRKRLHQAAEAHRPDREAMLARIEQGMSRGPDAERGRRYRRRRQASWLKATLAGVAAVAALGVGGFAVAAGIQQHAPERPAPIVVPSSSSSAEVPPQPSTSAPATKAPPSSTPTPRHSVAPTANGVVSAHGDVNAHSTVYWEQNDLTLDLSQPLSALTVELRVAATSGVQSTGTWRTAPADDFTVTVTPSGGFLVYRWTLKPGRTIPAAQQIFAAQFNHSVGKRDAGKDTFVVVATAAGHAVTVRGGFPAGG